VENLNENVAIVGAGVFGAWTAHHLQRQGHRVSLIDAVGPAHPCASSGGGSRLIRGAYGRDSIYTRMARDSLPQWKALSEKTGLPIFIPCGILFLFPAEEPYQKDTLAVHEELGLPTRALTRAEMASRFPMIDFEGIEIGIYEPTFGALLAQRAVQTLVESFVRAGGAYVTALVEPPVSTGESLHEIHLSSGERITADHFVFAAGPWLPKLFKEVIGPRIRVTRQEIFYFAPPDGDARFAPDAMSGWADFNHGDMFYGMPDIEGRGVKIAFDQHGIEVDPDTQDRRSSQNALDQVIAYRDRRFPLLRGAPLTGAEVCQYENSSNGDLLIDVHPQWENVLLVGGGSGHGFKHGPEVGRYAAARLTGAVCPEPRFSLSTKSETHGREVH
jgi:glycine/D-amino acid oxidase-like deaminating enzyme